MKILSIISSGYEQGGVETTVVSYNAIFRKLGHEVRTISSNSHPEAPHYSDYEFNAIPSKGIKSFLYTLINPSAYKVTKKVLKEFQPDIVLLHTMQQATPSVLLALKQYPTIQCVHGPEAFTTSLLAWHMNKSSFKNEDYNLSNLTRSGKFRYFLLRHVYVPTYKFGFRNINKFLVFSEFTRDMLEKDGFTMKPIACIPLGIKLPHPLTATKSKNNSILYVGRLEIFKGVMDLINAMPAVLKIIPNAQLLLAGEGSYLPELKERENQLGITQSVTFKGHISQKSVAQLYSEATVVVVPSTWPETFGKVGIEAMSMGTPVIASDVGGVKDWLHNKINGFLVMPNNSSQLTRVIIKILSDSKLRNKMSKNALESATNFTADRFAQNLLQVIKETVEQ
jgi:glycosyltransferase involved in cell wall biosynthesis